MQFRPISVEDLPVLRRFYARQGRQETCVAQTAFFKWQFIDPCDLFGRESTCFWAAFEDDEIVAIAVATPGSFFLNGNRVSGCWHQEWIGEKPGAAFSLMKRQSEINDFLGIATQNIDSAVALDGIRKLIWTEVERLIAVIDPKKTLEFVFDRAPRTLAYLRNIAKLPPKSDPGSHENVVRFDSIYDTHWANVSRQFSFTLDRNAEVMNWRYSDHPMFDYCRMLFQSRAGNVYYVWRLEDATGRDGVVARICEVIGAPEAISHTFQHFRHVLAEQNVIFADFSCTNHIVNAALVHGGMHPHVLVGGTDLARLLQPVENRPEKRLNFSFSFNEKISPDGIFNYHNAYITRGDANQDRPLP
jgi:hypothetical protein